MDYRKALRASKDGTDLELMISARSSRTSVEGVEEWRSRVVMKVRAPPLEGRANKELESYLGSLFGVPVSIVHGHTARMKTVHVPLAPERVAEMLEDAS